MPSIHEEEEIEMVAVTDDERGYKIMEYHLVKNAKGEGEASSSSHTSGCESEPHHSSISDISFSDGTKLSSIVEKEEQVLYVLSRFTRSMIEGEAPKVVPFRFS